MQRPSNRQSHATLAHLSSRLAESRRLLLEAISGFDEEDFRGRPEPNQWSAAETLAHLLDWEELLNSRIALALEKDGADLIPTTDEEHDAKAGLGLRAPVPQLIHGLQASRRRNGKLLGAMKPGDLDRCLMHPVRREMVPVAAMVEKLIVHEEEHAAHIAVLHSLARARTPSTAVAPEVVQERSM